MAYLQTAAILTRVREVLVDSEGVFRTVPVARFSGDLPEGLAEHEELRRALTAARVEVSLLGLSPAPESPPITGNLVIYDLALEVKCIRLLTRDGQLTDSTRSALRALAAEDADVVRQALSYPQNLSATEAAASTDLVSGLLRWTGSRIRVRRSLNAGAQLLETIHALTGKAISRPAV